MKTADSVLNARGRLTVPWLIVPPAAALLVFFLMPLLVVLAVSFASRGTYGGIEWTLTVSNYTSILDPL